MSCILCGNSPVNLYEIKDTREDIVELFGARTEMCIEENQLICRPCQKMLEKLAQLKRRLRYLILRPSEDRKPVELRHIWSLFSSFQLDKEDKQKRSIPTPNPSILFTVSDCEDFSEYNPKKYKGRPRKSDKKKGHGWTRRKRNTSSLSTRPSTRASTRASTRTSVATPFSSLSGLSTYASSPPNTPHSDKSYLSGYSRRSTRRTAAAIEANEEINILKEPFDTNILYCPDKKCSLYYMNVDLLNYHIKLHHKSPQLFNCTECSASFSLQEHLKIHSKIHDFSPFFCLMCAEPQDNRVQLQNHLDQHMFFSAPCAYCDKFFLTEEQLNAHHKNEHYKKRKNKVITQKKSVLRQITFKKHPRRCTEDSDLLNRQDSNRENLENNSEFSHERNDHESISDNPRLQTFQGKEYDVYVALQQHEGLEVTAENLFLENVEYYTGDGYEASEDRTHIEMEEDENPTREEVTEDVRSEFEPTISENIVEISGNEEIEKRNSSDTSLMQESSSNDDDDNNTGQPLVNGFSDGNDTEVMDVVSDDDNHRSQENPS